MFCTSDVPSNGHSQCSVYRCGDQGWGSRQLSVVSVVTMCTYLQVRMIFKRWGQQWQTLLGGGRTLVSPWVSAQVTWVLSTSIYTLPAAAWEECSYCGWDRATMYVPLSKINKLSAEQHVHQIMCALLRAWQLTVNVNRRAGFDPLSIEANDARLQPEK